MSRCAVFFFLVLWLPIHRTDMRPVVIPSSATVFPHFLSDSASSLLGSVACLPIRGQLRLRVFPMLVLCSWFSCMLALASPCPAFSRTLVLALCCRLSGSTPSAAICWPRRCRDTATVLASPTHRVWAARVRSFLRSGALPAASGSPADGLFFGGVRWSHWCYRAANTLLSSEAPRWFLLLRVRL